MLNKDFKSILRNFPKKLKIYKNPLNFIYSFPITLETRYGATFVAHQQSDIAGIEQPLCEYSGIDLERFGTVLDIGANIGGFTLYAASKGCTVLGVEAHPRNFQTLQENIQYNPHLGDRIDVMHKAVADEYGTAELEGEGCTAKLSEGGTIEVDTVPLNHFVNNIKDATLLKLDVEGAEFQILEEARSKTLEQIDAIVLEYHRWEGNPSRLTTKLRKEGFNIQYQRRDRQTGIIEAFSELDNRSQPS